MSCVFVIQFLSARWTISKAVIIIIIIITIIIIIIIIRSIDIYVIDESLIK